MKRTGLSDTSPEAERVLGGEVSERQWSDVLGVLRTQGDRLDGAYLDQWAAALGVADLMEQARRETGP
jgi:hypothetical protein